MRKYIGHEMQFLIDGVKISGTFVEEGKGDDNGLLIVKSNEGQVWRIPKGKVGLFTFVDPKDETCKYTPFHVLFCHNEKTKCPGIQLIKAGGGVKKKDVEEMVSPCPCRESSCRMGTKGELKTVDGDFLRQMLDNMQFGDFPEKKEEKKSVSKPTSGTTEDGSGNSPA